MGAEGYLQLRKRNFVYLHFQTLTGRVAWDLDGIVGDGDASAEEVVSQAILEQLCAEVVNQ